MLIGGERSGQLFQKLTLFFFIVPEKRHLLAVLVYQPLVAYAYLPYTESSLTAVGATSHAKLFTDFCDENQININDEAVKNFRDNEDIFKKKMGTFDEFDTEYYSLVENDPIEPLLAEYVRNNVEHFEW